MNQVILVGNLGADPELRQTGNGKAVVSLRVATQDGQDVTNWHNVVVWERQAEACARYLHKGSKVAVSGRIQYREVERDGQRRTYTDIVAHRVEFMSKGGGEGQRSSYGGGQREPAPSTYGQGSYRRDDPGDKRHQEQPQRGYQQPPPRDDDIPF